MPLLQRVATLIRANLNELVDKAENPETMLKQLLLDLQNQYMQVKTQAAMAIADQHLLEKKRAEHSAAQSSFVRKAQLALKKGDEELARTALSRSVIAREAAAGFTQQIEDQAEEVRLLRDALARLEDKLAEARAKADLLLARHRRAKAMGRAASATAPSSGPPSAFEVLARANANIGAAEGIAAGNLLLTVPDASSRLESLDREEQVDRLLAELKTKALPA